MLLTLPTNERFIQEHGAYPRTLKFGGGKQTAVQRKLRRVGAGGFEPTVQAAILSALELSKGKVFYDVGAHVGFYASIVSAIFGRPRVIAFEPTPETCEICAAVRDSNGFDYPIVNKAVSNNVGLADFFVSRKAETSNSLDSLFRSGAHDSKVDCITLDSLQSFGMPDPNVIKIDVENHEAEVISGGLAMIERARPIIVCEILSGTNIAMLVKVMEELSAWDYKFHALKQSGISRGMSLEDAFRLRDRARIRDWMFSPNRVGDRFRAIFDEWSSALAVLAAEAVEARENHTGSTPVDLSLVRNGYAK